MCVVLRANLKTEVTSVVTGDEALLGGRVEGEGPADELLVEGALDLARNLVADVVDDGVEVARVRVVRSLVGAFQVACGWNRALEKCLILQFWG